MMVGNINAVATTGIRHAMSGRGFIGGVAPAVVTVGGAPAQRAVRITDKRTNVLMAEVRSDPASGAWRVDWLDPERVYVVTAFDHEGRFNAVIRDGIKPAAMEDPDD